MRADIRERGFTDHPPEHFGRADVNAHVKQYWDAGPPVMRAEEAEQAKGRWSEVFGRQAPLHLEIGTGNGFFFAEMARRSPEFNWVGVEIRYKRVNLTAKKVAEAGATERARVVRYDANLVDALFAPGEIHGLYINHPDPWPKERHAKNRLLCGDWLDLVAVLLAPGAELQLKSDHRPNIEVVANNLPGRPFELLGRSEDIDRDGAPWPDDVVTNYQRKFREKGLPVYAIRLRRL